MDPFDRGLANLPLNRPVVFGAGASADVVLPAADGLADRHARVTRGRDGLVIQDLDTWAGTTVNGREVRGRVLARPGDRIRIGGLAGVVPATAAPPPARGLALEVCDAVRAVRTDDGPRNILDAVSFGLRPGQFVGVLGASGSGKSTLMKTLAGLAPLTRGEVRLAGYPAAAPALRTDRRIAYLPQDVIIHEQLPAALALEYVARLKRLPGADAGYGPLVTQALTQVKLAERADTPIVGLSGGQRKRVALAAELLGDPGLVLLDEATSGLDPATEADMMDLFRALADGGRTVVCVTHFPGRLHLCDRLIYLMRGRLIFDGPPDDLRAFFGVKAIEDAYARQGVRPPEEWEAEFRRTRPAPPPAALPVAAPARPPSRPSSSPGGTSGCSGPTTRTCSCSSSRPRSSGS